jgi:hypothetical protein
VVILILPAGEVGLSSQSGLPFTGPSAWRRAPGRRLIKEIFLIAAFAVIHEEIRDYMVQKKAPLELHGTSCNSRMTLSLRHLFPGSA